jgi:lysophospholipid hydrolase
LQGLVVPKLPSAFEPRDPAALLAFKKLRSEVLEKYRALMERPAPQRPPHSNDFARLARRLCGKSIGLVLGGGGARGISHLVGRLTDCLRHSLPDTSYDAPKGVLRALEDYGVPIDQVGGTSIGALIGGLYAREGDMLSSVGRAKQFSRRMGNIWRILSDLTYPIVAYTTVRSLFALDSGAVSLVIGRCRDMSLIVPYTRLVR